MKILASILFALALCSGARAADTGTVKLRALELRNVTVHSLDATGKSVETPLNYSQLVEQILTGPSLQGSSTEEVLKTVAVWLPIKKQIDAKATRLLLTPEQYTFLTQKIDAFRWGTPNAELTVAIADFITYVRGIQESDFAATEANPPAKPPPSKG